MNEKEIHKTMSSLGSSQLFTMNERYKELPLEKELKLLNKARTKGLPADGWRVLYDTEQHRHTFFTSDGHKACLLYTSDAADE